MSGYRAAYDAAGGVPRIVVQRNTFTAEQFCDFVGEHYPEGRFDQAPLVLVSAVEDALRQYPHSARLWCRLGDLLQSGATTCLGVSSPFECYLKAVTFDPLCGEAYAEMAFLLDIEDEEFPGVITCFQQAIRCDASIHSYVADSYIALAQALIQTGKRAAANELLDWAKDVFERSVEKVTVAQDELAAG